MASVTLPFLLRRLRVAVRPRGGAAPAVPWDPAAFAPETPRSRGSATRPSSCAWTASTFSTDPIFSHRCSPVQFMGPPRLVPPGVPLDALPRLDFALLSHDHYDHTDRASIRALAARGVPFLVPRGHGRAGARVRRPGPGARLVGVGGDRRPARALRARPALLGTRPHRSQPAAVGGLGRGRSDAPLLPRRRHRLLRRLRRDRRSASAPSTSRRCRSAPTCRAR